VATEQLLKPERNGRPSPQTAEPGLGDPPRVSTVVATARALEADPLAPGRRPTDTGAASAFGARGAIAMRHANGRGDGGDARAGPPRGPAPRRARRPAAGQHAADELCRAPHRASGAASAPGAHPPTMLSRPRVRPLP
jgi:hypothetical protein